MQAKDVLVGALIVGWVLGPYFLGAFRGPRASIEGRGFFVGLAPALSTKGFLWATALPAGWLLLFYSFVLHVRLARGRWPEFGESLQGAAFAFHDQGTRQAAQALVSSLYVAPGILIGCLLLRRWRHVSIYALTYGAAVGVAIGVLFLAPGPFLSWYFD